MVNIEAGLNSRSAYLRVGRALYFSKACPAFTLHNKRFTFVGRLLAWAPRPPTRAYLSKCTRAKWMLSAGHHCPRSDALHIGYAAAASSRRGPGSVDIACQAIANGLETVNVESQHSGHHTRSTHRGSRGLAPSGHRGARRSRSTPHRARPSGRNTLPRSMRCTNYDGPSSS